MTRDPFCSDPAAAQPPPDLAPGDPSSHRKLGRRALIGAGAGLLLGAGATQTANTLMASSPPAKPDPPSPAEALMTEHGVLKRLLLVYQTASDQLAAGQTPPAEAITQTADLITDYIEGFHEGLEEAYIFPRVQPAHPTLVHTLLVQHDRGRHLTSAINFLSTQNLEQTTARTSLRRYLDMFVAMYARHEAWEDTVIFPAIRAMTGPQTIDQLAVRFAELESAQYGDAGYTRILARVSNIERHSPSATWPPSPHPRSTRPMTALPRCCFRMRTRAAVRARRTCLAVLRSV